MSDAALVVSELTAGYRPGVPIITDLDVRVGAGEVVTVIGPNGAGKSTLVKAIAGLLTVDAGRIVFGGVSLVGVEPHRMAENGVSYVPQNANVFETLTVRQNLLLAAQRHSGSARVRVDVMLGLFTVLGEKLRQRAGRLSGGQRQLLAIAMALAAEPALVLMDEPTAGLSPRASREVLALVREVARRGVSVLLVEQNAKAALGISDRAYILADGRNQIDADAHRLLEDPAVADIYLGGRAREAQ